MTFPLGPRPVLRGLGILAGLGLAALAASIALRNPAKQTLETHRGGRRWFEPALIRPELFGLFDLGVVDADADGALDLFTSNHSFRQLLLRGDGRGGFGPDVFSAWGLDQDPGFPGLEYPGAEPRVEAPGLYLYWRRRSLVVRSHRLREVRVVRGRIDLSAPVTPGERRGAEVTVTERRLPTGALATTLEFALRGDGGRVWFTPANVSLPVRVRLAPEVPADRVYVGHFRTPAGRSAFAPALRDRHGMAWADLDGEGMRDVFILRGGLRGRMASLPERLSDELLLHDRTGARFEDRAEELGVRKEGCAGLQAAWVDVDGDGLLDISVVCGQFAASGRPRPRVYRREPRGGFVARPIPGVAPAERGTFLWLDVERDGDADFLWAGETKFRLYENAGGRFRERPVGPNPGGRRPFESTGKLSTADFDGDGDLDVFSASPTGNALLVNEGGGFRVVEAAAVGLPSGALTANWVDYDNDGVPDLHLLPHGIYRQRGDHAFERTGLLAGRPGELLDARASWFDADNDGDRDLVVALRHRKSLARRAWERVFGSRWRPTWTLRVYRNVGATNHWLKVLLVGPPGNRSAIGAHVEVAGADRSWFQTVGQSEGSHFSQGHDRLYFGLGKEAALRSVKVYWPDGRVGEIAAPGRDRLLVVRYGPG